MHRDMENSHLSHTHTHSQVELGVFIQPYQLCKDAHKMYFVPQREISAFNATGVLTFSIVPLASQIRILTVCLPSVEENHIYAMF